MTGNATSENWNVPQKPSDFFLFKGYITAILSKLNIDTKVKTEIRDVASPICSGEYIRALIIQKKKPKNAIIAVLSIKYMEFLYKESFLKWLYKSVMDSIARLMLSNENAHTSKSI